MPTFSPADLAAWTGGRWASPPASPLTGFCFDSRRARPGDVFVALRSGKADGHAFVDAAFAAGAAAAVVDAPPAGGGAARPLLQVPDALAAFRDAALGWRRKVAPFVVGVTGSVGKSTVKEWLAALLADWKPTARTEANFNNEIGLPASLLSMDADAAFGVFEAGVSHPGDMAPLARAMRPDAAVVTAIAPVHVEFFGSLAEIAREKAGLLRVLPKAGFAVLDARGDFFGYLSSQAPCRVVGVCVVGPAEEPPASAAYVARAVRDETGDFLLSGPGLDAPRAVSLGRPGRHNVLDAVLAAAAARECGAPWEGVLSRLGRLPSMQMRWERFVRGGQNWIGDAYNASPASMAASLRAFALAAPPPRAARVALQSLSSLRAFAAVGDPGVLDMRGAAPRRAFVLGDMLELGPDAAAYHQSVAKILGEIETCASDVLVCVGGLARHYAGPGFRGRAFFASDASDAARILRRELPAGSTVLLKASHSVRLDAVPSLYLDPLASLKGAPASAARVAVLGAGRSGQAARRLLETLGVEAVLLDGADPFPEGRVDFAVVSPGIPGGHPWLAACAARAIPALSELELGFRLWRGRVLAVTGSKGKSSVVKLCAEALALAGETAAPCGNYGTPLCEVLLDPSPPHWAVVEASSFQLERVDLFRPDVAVLLNLQADHLDRHGTPERYAAAKFNLFSRFRGEDDVAIVAADAYRAALAAGAPGARRLRGECAAPKDAGRGMLLFGPAPAVPAGALAAAAAGYFGSPVLGPAALAAALALSAAGLDEAEVAAAFRAFRPLPHRMQTVAERDGVAFVDDSKATSLAALAAALEMAGRPARLIAGGRLKESDLDPVKFLLAKNAKKVYLIGESSQTLFEAWHGAVPCEVCGGMEAAVEAAVRDARRGEVVLLAPGCASFDQFGGYGERGDCFALCVAKALQNPARSRRQNNPE